MNKNNYMEQINNFFKNNQFDQALSLCDQNSDKSIEHIILNFKGAIYFKQKNFKLAKENFLRSADIDNNFIDPHKNLYLLHLNSKELKDAINDAVIAEDHWQKPGKLPVERAHGLTIYFPTDGAETGYDDLLITDSKWFEFINNFATEMEPEAHFLEVNSMSVDTGTGYDDSVLVSGSYDGNASEVRIRLLNSEGNVTNTYNGNISLGDILGIYLQPTKSGNYSLEIGIYGDDGFLHDHHINENLFVDLHLPDLAVTAPEIMIEGDNGGLYQVQNIQTDDSFLIKGSVYNLGTVKANNVTVSVNDNGNTHHFNFPEIGPNQEKIWNINKNGTNYAGEYFLDVSVSSEDEFEIDENNNQTSLSFFILDKQAHEYNVDTKNKNLLEINTNQEGEYEFPWLETYVTITNDKVQSWDFVTITAEIPDNWEFCGSVSEQYKQIGNAVPVNMATEIGYSIISFLNKC